MSPTEVRRETKLPPPHGTARRGQPLEVNKPAARGERSPAEPIERPSPAHAAARRAFENQVSQREERIDRKRDRQHEDLSRI